MATNNLSFWEELIADSSPGKHGYHPRMEEVQKNDVPSREREDLKMDPISFM
jgi:hypothetical protein